MAREWTPQDRNARRRELIGLYEHQKLPVAEIASALGLKPGTIYSRLRRLGIPTRTRVEGKNSHNARIIQVPALSGDLAEFCGIILGDGHVGSGQLWVSVNAHTDLSYVP